MPIKNNTPHYNCNIKLIIMYKTIIHCKNTWVTLTTVLGCLSCISVTRECDTIPNWCSWRRSFLVRVASLLFQNTYLVTFLAFLPQPCNQRTQGRCVCVRPKKQQISPEMLTYAFWKEGSISTIHPVQIVSTLWTLCVTHTKGMQLRWPKYGQSNLNCNICKHKYFWSQ